MRYLATLPAGMESLARDCLPRGARLEHAAGGAAVIESGARPKAWPGLYTNIYLILCQARCSTFGPLLRVAEATGSSAFFGYTRPGQTFGVRFSRDGRLAKVSPEEMARAEALIRRAGRFQVSRAKPEVEFWYLLRQNGMGYYALLIQEGREGEAERGALRPSVAYGMAAFARLRPGEAAIDPFSGSGALGAAAAHFGVKLQMSDLQPRAGAVRADARQLSHIESASADVVLTDPPWGEFDRQTDVPALYAAMFREFARVLKPAGRAILLSSQQAALIQAAKAAGFAPGPSLRLLINGKKAALTLFRRAAQRGEGG